jgi:hypothetical protein
MLLGWLPIIGPIIDGVFSVAKNITDNKSKKDFNDLDEIKSRLEVMKAFKDDIMTRLCRDLIMFPVAIWCAIGTWDTIIAVRYPDLRFLIAPFPTGPLEYLPFAVLAFLFGMAIRNR